MQTSPLGSASVRFSGVADDSRKDGEYLDWLGSLTNAEKATWLTCASLIRRLDRAAEAQLMSGKAPGGSAIDTDAEEYAMATGKEWLAYWHSYGKAVEKYHRKDLVVRDVRDFEMMSEELGASVFQLFPFLSAEERELIAPLGMLDQAYNILRDVDEDDRAGLCFLPQSIDGNKETDHAFIIAYLLERCLPKMWEKCQPFLTADHLHPSVKAMRASCLKRYKRIEQHYRFVHYEPTTFAQTYWS